MQPDHGILRYDPVLHFYFIIQNSVTQNPHSRNKVYPYRKDSKPVFSLR
jgi:hypothetical protein